MKIKPNYFIIPLIVIAVAAMGGLATDPGLQWYATLQKPDLTPPNWLFGPAWTTIYILTTISALIVWNNLKRDYKWSTIVSIFIVNGILNAGWSWVFFSQHLLEEAVAVSFLLGATVYVLIIMLWKRSKTASLLLLPYAAWVSFATYLSYRIFQLN